MPLQVLQNFVFPTAENLSASLLYLRYDAGAVSDDTALVGKVKIAPGRHVDFATYYNGFSLNKWRKISAIDNLGLRVELNATCAV